jgi:hypothetical protein
MKGTRMYLVYQLTETVEYPGYGRYPLDGGVKPTGTGEPLPGSEQLTAHLLGVSKALDSTTAIEELGHSPGGFIAVEAESVELSLRPY